MKTLILNGSPRENGRTAKLISIFTRNLTGEYTVINAYRSNISPCIDCRCCMTQSGCPVGDDMQEVYNCINECDNIAIFSPVYFSGLTPPIVSIGSRLQTLYCKKTFRKETDFPQAKKGAVILSRDGDGAPDIALKSARIFLRQMYCEGALKEAVFCGEYQNDIELKAIADYFNGISRLV